ncbi:hypothetical protein [Dehalobacterium formicoaceticum]|uniref:hypothetical protein n=1 Tax=Dehalobacterium formicoaceticum TaxID=51515 RepID=UPI0031F71CD6
MARKRRSLVKRETKLMQEFLDKGEILQEWDLSIKRMKKINNDYKIKTHKGEKILKIAFQEDRVMFMHLALEHLAGQGCFQGIPRLIPTKYGDFYVKSDLGIYYLTDWVGGKQGKRDELDQVLAFARYLGEIHLSAMFFHAVPPWAIRERWDDIAQGMTEKTSWAEENLNHLPPEVQTAWASYEIIAHKAANLLKLAGYPALVEAAKENKTFCHRRFEPGQGIIAKGVTHILHWEHCAYGVQVGDLVYFMQQVMPYFQWNQQIGEQIITSYHRTKHLSREEVMTLEAALMYPDTFVRFMKKCRLSKFPPDEFSKKFAQAHLEEQEKHRFIEAAFGGIRGKEGKSLPEDDEEA